MKSLCNTMHYFRIALHWSLLGPVFAELHEYFRISANYFLLFSHSPLIFQFSICVSQLKSSVAGNFYLLAMSNMQNRLIYQVETHRRRMCHFKIFEEKTSLPYECVAKNCKMVFRFGRFSYSVLQRSCQSGKNILSLKMKEKFPASNQLS